jgi:hypothetical protein
MQNDQMNPFRGFQGAYDLHTSPSTEAVNELACILLRHSSR